MGEYPVGMRILVDVNTLGVKYAGGPAFGVILPENWQNCSTSTRIKAAVFDSICAKRVKWVSCLVRRTYDG